MQERVSRNPTDEHYLHRTAKSVECRGGNKERTQPMVVSAFNSAMTILNSEDMARRDPNVTFMFAFFLA